MPKPRNRDGKGWTQHAALQSSQAAITFPYRLGAAALEHL